MIETRTLLLALALTACDTDTDTGRTVMAPQDLSGYATVEDLDALQDTIEALSALTPQVLSGTCGSEDYMERELEEPIRILSGRVCETYNEHQDNEYRVCAPMFMWGEEIRDHKQTIIWSCESTSRTTIYAEFELVYLPLTD